MKKGLLLIALVFSLLSTFAQGEPALKKGQAQINFGYPPLAGVDIAVNDFLTVGIKTSLQGYYIYFADNPFFIAGIVSDFHFNKAMGLSSNKDVYAGLNLYTRLDEYSTEESYIPIPGIHFGSRWYWSDTFGFGAEVGFSVSVIFSVGFTARL